MVDQLTLGIRLLDEANFESFYIGDHAEVVATLKQLPHVSVWNNIYLSGSSGVGKSHLLQACCQKAVREQRLSFYLPLGNEFSPLILEDLDTFSLVCIDNLEVIAGQRVWEEALFHFFNRSLQNKTNLLFAATNTPRQLPFILPDLVSRLASGITYTLRPANDIQKLAALQLRAKIRGFILSEEVGRYLLNHYPRDMSALFELLELLDQASLEAQHRLTIPFIKSVLCNTSAE